MTEEYQPNPDELLKAIQEEESKKNLGKLKIFFGMSAGVGKTYAMLEEAKKRLKEGIPIIVGTINTHGRKETEELLQGLPIIPEKWIKYKDTVFEEMDLEAILQQQPSIVLVDELAHTNVPGSRHPKRWQDVIEILDAGIDVYTTLNVQHIESRKDLVESFAGIQIRETVPDLILERASTIELVDISPSELLERLKEGKVYLGDQSQIAAKNFFKEDTLTALREIALRFTAEKVEHDLHSILSQSKKWKTREKLMVAISPSPYSIQLIRRTRRKAFELDAPWVAVYVDVGKTLSDEEQIHLTNHLNLAQELGAEVVTTYDNDIAAAILRIAQVKNITQLVIGRSISHRKWNFFEKSLADRLEEKSQQLDLLILRQDKLVKPPSGIHPSVTLTSSYYDYILSVMTIFGISILGFLLLPLIGYKSVGFIFLLGISLLSFFVGQGPIFLAAILSTFSWDYFFIPPTFAFIPTNLENWALMFIYFSTATIIGILTSRIHKEDKILQLREKKLQHLYEIEKEIANASHHYQSLRLNVVSRLQSIFNGQFDILIKREGEKQPNFDSKMPILQQEKEQAVAQWVLQNGKIAGWSTSTLPSAKGLYLPIKYSQSTIGVLVYSPHTDRLLSLPEMNFLQTVAQQIGISLEHYLHDERIAHQSYTTQVEKLQISLLQSISKRFHTPLNQILEITKQLTDSHDHEANLQHLRVIEQATGKLRMMIDNLLSLAELESGFVKFEKNEQNIKNFVENCVKESENFLEERQVQLFFPKTPTLISFDSRLMKYALKNILFYITTHAIPQQPIQIIGEKEKKGFKLSILNEGLNIESEYLTHLFDKAYPFFDAKFQDEQLGFIIAKSVMDIHQGKIETQHRKEGGISFSLFIP